MKTLIPSILVIILIFPAWSSAGGAAHHRARRTGRQDLIRPPVFLYKWPETYRPEFPSPDGKYVFRLTVEEAEARRVDILPRASHHPPILASVEDGNAVWAPHRPHTLVVAGNGIYGPALLAYCNGGRRLKTLVSIKSNSDKLFALFGVSKDGRKVYYNMTPASAFASKANNLAKQEERVYVVRLPRGA